MSAVPSVTADLAAPLEARLARFPRSRSSPRRSRPWVIAKRAQRNRDALPLVLLHGIGSGAASWVQQFEALGATRRVLAWDAPGYGASTPVAPASPSAADYADVLRGWLDALGIERCVLVGHSLGAIIAGAFAAAHPQRVAGLLLLSPAGGYGAAAAEVRESKRDQRLAMLAELGPAGLAEKRSANMLSAHADDTARAWVRWNMARIVPHGYAQATHLLANADLAADLARFHGRIAWRWAPTTPSRRRPRASGWHKLPARACRSCRVPATPAISNAADAYTAIIDTFCRTSAGPRSH